MSVRSVHASVLRTGSVLLVAGSGNDLVSFNAGTFRSTVRNPSTGTFSDIPLADDLFCSGHVQLPDGRILLAGGTAACSNATTNCKGLAKSYVLDPMADTYTATNDMPGGGRWYPSLTALGDGTTLAVGGLDENADGRLFYGGVRTFGNAPTPAGSNIYDPVTATVNDVPGLRNVNLRDRGAAVLLPPEAPSGRVVPRGNGSPSPAPSGLDGCDHNYVAGDSDRRICVPKTPPGGRRLDCAYLKAHGIGPGRAGPGRVGSAGGGPSRVVLARRRRLAWALVTVPLVVALAVRVVAHPHAALLGLWTAVSVLMLVIAVVTLTRGQYSWQLPERVDHVDLGDTAPPRHRISLIVPARDEPVLGRTPTHLPASDYPADLIEVVVMVSRDEVDRTTRQIAEQIAERHPNVRVIAPQGSRRSKPLSLEDARRHCTGDLVGIVDAESLLAPGLLAHVNTLAVRQPGVGIFQGGVQLMNVRGPVRDGRAPADGPRVALRRLDTDTSWWRARNCLEYYIWFMSRLRFQARARFIPLGGNTVFVRRDVLHRLGGWDVDCLTEDCDLGVRACVAGVRATVFYHPDLTTREETPESLRGLVVQRTRWMAARRLRLDRPGGRGTPPVAGLVLQAGPGPAGPGAVAEQLARRRLPDDG